MSYKIVSIDTLSAVNRLALTAAFGVFDGADEITLNKSEGSAVVRYGGLGNAKTFQKGVLGTTTSKSKPKNGNAKRLRPRGFYSSQAWADIVAHAEERAGESMLMSRDVARMANCDRAAVTLAARNGELQNWTSSYKVGNRNAYLFSVSEATEWAKQFRERYA